MIDNKEFIIKYVYEKKLQQNEIALKMGYSVEYISRILNGKDKMNIKFVSKFKECYPDFDKNINNSANEKIDSIQEAINIYNRLLDNLEKIVDNNTRLVDTNAKLVESHSVHLAIIEKITVKKYTVADMPLSIASEPD
jgi:transcriptional regulator with XRE-family HTH domain